MLDGSRQYRLSYNSIDEEDMDETSPQSTVAAAELRQLIERIERLEEEKATLADDIKEVMAELKRNPPAAPKKPEYPNRAR